MTMKWTKEKIEAFLAPFSAWLKDNVMEVSKWEQGLQLAYEEIESICKKMRRAPSDEYVKKQIKNLKTEGTTTGIEKTGYPVTVSTRWKVPAHAKKAWDHIEAELKKECLVKKGGLVHKLSHRRTHAKKDEDGKVTQEAGRFYRAREELRNVAVASFMASLKADLENGDWDGSLEAILKHKVATLPEGVDMDA